MKIPGNLKITGLRWGTRNGE